MRDVNAIIFDKTGTITKGEPSVTDIIPLDSGTEEQLLTIAASGETASEHPLGQAIVQAAKEKQINLKATESFRAIPGKGIEAVIEGIKISMGNRKLMQEQGIDTNAVEAKLAELEEQGKTAMLIADGVLSGIIAVADTVKKTAVRPLSHYQGRPDYGNADR